LTKAHGKETIIISVLYGTLLQTVWSTKRTRSQQSDVATATRTEMRVGREGERKGARGADGG